VLYFLPSLPNQPSRSTIALELMRYTSDELFHFVGRNDPTNHETNFQTILKILESKNISYWPHDGDDRSWEIDWQADFRSGEPLIKQITCFCDIPYESLGIHLNKYGMFGISFDRRFLIRKKARPVFYHPLQAPGPNTDWSSPHSTTLLEDWICAAESFLEQIARPMMSNVMFQPLGVVHTNPNNAAWAMDDFLTDGFFAFLKVFDGHLAEDAPENFYMEREWRIRGYLRFQPDDVVSIVVHRDFIKRLASTAPEYAGRIFPAPTC
jgi:hypothetical protein